MDKNLNQINIFKIMVKRDLLIQNRNWKEFVFRVGMLPFILILTYGFILPQIGVLDISFPNQMFPGMLGMSLLVTGIHGTAIPLTMDFNNTREIEDRLQAPVNVRIVAWTKMFVGIIEAWIGALIVLPISLLFMGSYLNISLDLTAGLSLFGVLLLSSITSATLGLLVGTIVRPMQIAAMFPGFLMPLIFTGAIFFNWSALQAVPLIKYLVLLNPLVYINEALRFILNSGENTMPIFLSLAGIVVYTLILGYYGMKRFTKMANR